MYVLAYTWSPEFCYNQNSYKGCATPRDYWTKYFTIHGLWPQYKSGGYPSYCTNEVLNSDAIIAKFGFDNMADHWPNVKVTESDPDYASFWEYEWSKHGTCSGLDQTTWVNQALATQDKLFTPEFVTSNVGKSVSATDLRNSFGGKTMASLQCTSGKYLNGVYTCWLRNSNGTVGEQTTCPSDVQKEDTCSSSSILIQSF